LTSESVVWRPSWFSAIAVDYSSEALMIGFATGRITAQSALGHDWDARATEMIAEARKMPLGPQRSDALGEAGRLRIAAEMKRWLSTK
jgi:hypothetical protein